MSSSVSSALPERPDLAQLRRRAKELRRAWAAGDPAALARVAGAHPKFSEVADVRSVEPRLADCQLVIAREAGFDSWPKLRTAVLAAADGRAHEFVTLGCLSYDDPHYDSREFWQRASAMLAADSGLSRRSVWAAATAGDADAVRLFADEDRRLVSAAGPHGWVPLLCACYSRVTPVRGWDAAVATVAVLLEYGADPNAYTLKGNTDDRLDQTRRRFTALTGLIGGGSTGVTNQPPHPRWRPIAQLLLEHGADPVDEEALDHGSSVTDVDQAGLVRLLVEYGLTPADRVRRPSTADPQPEPVTVLGRELGRAAMAGDVGLVDALVGMGAPVDEAWRGRTPLAHARMRGHVAVVRRLEAAGATPGDMSPVDRFVAACLAVDRAEVARLAAADPGLVAAAPPDMVNRAASTRRVDAVELVIGLGFDPNFMDESGALHNTAWRGDEAMVFALLERGASLTLREPFYDGTAVGGADFFHRERLRDRLLDEGPIDLFDALLFDRLDRVPDVLERDPAALERRWAQVVTRPVRPEDEVTPLMRMAELGKAEAMRVLIAAGADTSVRHPDGRTLPQVARDAGVEPGVLE